VAVANALQLEIFTTLHHKCCAVFGQMCTEHAHKLTFTGLQSKFWHCH